MSEKGFFREQWDRAMALLNSPKVLERCADINDSALKGLISTALHCVECTDLVERFSATGYDKEALAHARELLRESQRQCRERLAEWQSTQRYPQ